MILLNKQIICKVLHTLEFDEKIGFADFVSRVCETTQKIPNSILRIKCLFVNHTFLTLSSFLMGGKWNTYALWFHMFFCKQLIFCVDFKSLCI